MKNSKWAYTFNWWFKELPSEVKMVDVSEYEGYQSEYMYCFSYLKSRGWERHGSWWVSPDNKFHFNNIYGAYRCAKFYEDIVKQPL